MLSSPIFTIFTLHPSSSFPSPSLPYSSSVLIFCFFVFLLLHLIFFPSSSAFPLYIYYCFSFFLCSSFYFLFTCPLYPLSLLPFTLLRLLLFTSSFSYFSSPFFSSYFPFLIFIFFLNLFLLHISFYFYFLLLFLLPLIYQRPDTCISTFMPSSREALQQNVTRKAA
jgi:hypothetical protein